MTSLLGPDALAAHGNSYYALPEAIPDICHGRHGHVRVNFFWPV